MTLLLNSSAVCCVTELSAHPPATTPEKNMVKIQEVTRKPLTMGANSSENTDNSKEQRLITLRLGSEHGKMSFFFF